MANLLYIAPFWALLAIGCVAAFASGGWPERAVGLLFASAAAGSLAVVGGVSRFHSVEQPLLAIDLLLTCALGVVALRADRWWPMCVTSLVTIGTLAHLGEVLTPGLLPRAYQFMEQVSSYPALLVWGAGIWREAARRRRAASIWLDASALEVTHSRSLIG